VGGDLNGFQEIGALPVYFRGRHHSVWSWPSYRQMLLDTRNKNIYGLGVSMFFFFRYFDNSCLRRDGTTMPGHDVHNIRCYLTQETRMYMVMGWRSQWYLRYIRTLLVSGGRDHNVRSWLTYHQMLLDTRNKNISYIRFFSACIQFPLCSRRLLNCVE
jgi:hypothetical protein